MKQSDIFTLILVAGIGVFCSFFVVQMLLGDPKEAVVKFKTVVPIQGTLIEPDPEVFQSTAINPTIEVYVGSCEDLNQNGILDDFEIEACEKAQNQNGEEQGSTEENGEEQPQGE